MSHLSIRTHNENMLMSKIKPFREYRCPSPQKLFSIPRQKQAEVVHA